MCVCFKWLRIYVNQLLVCNLGNLHVHTYYCSEYVCTGCLPLGQCLPWHHVPVPTDSAVPSASPCDVILPPFFPSAPAAVIAAPTHIYVCMYVVWFIHINVQYYCMCTVCSQCRYYVS